MNLMTFWLHRLEMLALPVLCALGAHAEMVSNRLDFRCDLASKEAFLAQPYTWWGQGNYPVKPGERGTLIILSNSRIRYVFMLFGREDAKGAWYPTMGLLRPSKANWAMNDFFSFRTGKITSRQCAVKIEKLQKGTLALRYSHADFRGNITLQLFPDDERLYVSFLSQASCELMFSAYPSSYGGSWKQGLNLRQRFGKTNERLLPEGAHTLKPSECYVFLGDRYYDPERLRGEGPCALMFHPRKTSGKVIIGNYRCDIILNSREGIPAPLILFDFHGMANQSALEYMRLLPISVD